MAFEVGGIERARYRFNERSPFPGTALVADGTIQDIVPRQRVVIASTMTMGDRRISASLVTFEILPNGAGTDFVVTHQGAFLRVRTVRSYAKSRMAETGGAARNGIDAPSSLMPRNQVTIDRVFHALGDPTRRAILEKLSQRPFTVSALAEPLNITVAAVVQHLQALEECGLVRTEKVGRVRTCRIEPGGLAVAEKWIADRRTTGNAGWIGSATCWLSPIENYHSN